MLSDTHIRPGTRRRLPDAVYGELEQADVILHAGDVVVSELLDELAGFAPVHAVLGNNDHELVGRLPVIDQVLIEGVAIGLIHDSGPRSGRDGRMSRRFPDAKVVVYGHSHIPDDHEGLGGQVLFNPGSPTDRRAQPHHTYGIIEVADGALMARRIVAITG
ncbi:MAG: YfcE family phosphodiesterase [Acidimicrobiales bacterium]